MAKIRVIKKNDDYSMDYQVGDILEVTGTWYGGINVNSKTGIPLCIKTKMNIKKSLRIQIFLTKKTKELQTTRKKKMHSQKSWTRMF